MLEKEGVDHNSKVCSLRHWKDGVAQNWDGEGLGGGSTDHSVRNMLDLKYL